MFQSNSSETKGIIWTNTCYRRVHITKATLLQLGDRFEVEPGNGQSRESYLADHKIETYLIVPPKVEKPHLPPQQTLTLVFATEK